MPQIQSVFSVTAQYTTSLLNEFAEVKDLMKHRQKISWNLCFKCLKSSHCTVDSLSSACFKCDRKHYTSLCTNDKLQDNSRKKAQEPKEKILTSFGEKNVFYRIVIVYTNEIQCRSLVDTGAQSSCTSAALLVTSVKALCNEK